MSKIAILSANLGKFDEPAVHAAQGMDCDRFVFDDDNFPPRANAMAPRLQAKIPKMFGWQLVPGYDYYLWLDGNISLADPDAVKFFYDACQGYDLVVFRHAKRPNIRQEVRYTRKGINQQSSYMVGRYVNELHAQQYGAIQSDKSYVDDLLVNGGAFIYRDTPTVRSMFKEWWYNITRYIVQDQISFPYAIKTNGVKANILPDNIHECKYLSLKGHNYHAK